MATPSPLNWNQRGKAASPRSFASAEDFAAHHSALNSGPTGMHEKNTIQSGPHKGKTPDQVYAEYLDAGVALGIPRRSVDGSTNGRLLLGQAPGQAAAPGSSPGAPVSPRAASPVAQPTGTGGQLVPGRSAGSMVWKPSTSTQPAAPESTAQPAKTAPAQSPVSSTPAVVPISKAPSPRAKSFDGMSATQFGAKYAAREGRGNAFTGYKVPSQTSPSVTPTPKAAPPSLIKPSYNPSVNGAGMTVRALQDVSPSYATAHAVGGNPSITTSSYNPAVSGADMAAQEMHAISPSYAAAHTLKAASPVTPTGPAMGPAQQRLAAFTASNPPTLTDQQIEQKQQTFQANRDNLTAIQAQKGYAAERAKNGPQEILADPTPQTQDQKDANAAVGYTIKSTIPGSKVGPNFLNGKPYKSPLIADMAAPPAAPKPAGTPLSAVKPFAQVSVRPSTSLKPTLTLPTVAPSQPLIAGTRANGGPVQAGKPYLVGERGPEIVVPAQNGTVIPNHAVNPRLLTPRSRAVSPSQDWRSPTRPVKAARPSLVTMR